MKKIVLPILLIMVILMASCSNSQSSQPSYNPTSEYSQPTASSSADCKVEDRGTGRYCLDDNGEHWAWRGKICDPKRDYIVTEIISCINSRCQKDETILKNCKDYGADWICGYRTGQDAQDTVCAKPDWSVMKDV